jgi:hypothetical protein
MPTLADLGLVFIGEILVAFNVTSIVVAEILDVADLSGCDAAPIVYSVVSHHVLGTWFSPVSPLPTCMVLDLDPGACSKLSFSDLDRCLFACSCLASGTTSRGVFCIAA